MTPSRHPDHDLDLEARLAQRLLDVFIRAGLVLALVLLCYHIFSPFLSMMLWALILAVTIYPLHLKLAAALGGRQGRAATLIVLVAALLIVTPTVMLGSELGDSVHDVVQGVRDNTLAIPAPPEKVASWPLIGRRAHALWAQAHSDLPALVKSMQPKIGDLAAKALGIVAGLERGADLARLSTATVRAVASGVIGIACIQALLVGVCLLLAGIPFAGVLALIVLVLGVAQVPALLVTLPAIAYLWMSGHYETAPAAVYTVALFLAGMADNVLKPLMLGRGVDAPMPVILLGALGGMATGGILGMFVGATALALGYQIFMRWVDDHPQRPAAATPASDAS